MALDIYAWLAQRLHRIPRERPQSISWTALKGQFGEDYKRIRDFRRIFLISLMQVLTQYPDAKVEENGYGMTLFSSQPPVQKCLIPV